MKRINDDIKNRDFKPVYLLYGNEDYLKKQFADKLKNAISDRMNTTVYSDTFNEDEFISLADTLPFFSEKRVIILDRLNLFKKTYDKLNGLMDQIPEYLTVIIIENDIDKKRKLYKKLSNIGYICELNRLGEGELYRWIAGECAKIDIKITEKACKIIVDRTMGDMFLIANEIGKLSAYVGEKKEIREEDVKEVVPLNVEARVFDLIDAATRGRMDSAISLYEEAIEAREAPVKLFIMLERQLLNIYRVKKSGGIKSSVTKTNIPDFVMRKYINMAKGYSEEKLKYILKELEETEYKIKTGKISDKAGFEMALASFK